MVVKIFFIWWWYRIQGGRLIPGTVITFEYSEKRILEQFWCTDNILNYVLCDMLRRNVY
jgi:hypothetical protein